VTITAAQCRHPSVPKPKLSDFATPEYEPPTRYYRFANLHILALDQALRNTGIVEVTFDGPDFRVVGHETLTSSNDLAGNTAVLRAATGYYYTMRQLLMDRIVMGVPQVVVYELPPNTPGMYRPESSMLAASCLSIICEQLGLDYTMVQRQAACTMWASNPKATKTQLKRAMIDKFPFLKGDMAHADEHQWDALAMALTHAWEKSDG
jgi:hypothetical protein